MNNLERCFPVQNASTCTRPAPPCWFSLWLVHNKLNYYENNNNPARQQWYFGREEKTRGSFLDPVGIHIPSRFVSDRRAAGKTPSGREMLWISGYNTNELIYSLPQKTLGLVYKGLCYAYKLCLLCIFCNFTVFYFMTCELLYVIKTSV